MLLKIFLTTVIMFAAVVGLARFTDFFNDLSDKYWELLNNIANAAFLTMFFSALLLVWA